MRKWIGLLLFLSICSIVIAAPDALDGSVPESGASMSDGGGGEIPPFEAMAETTANIFIYVTLRQPDGPVASDIEIDSTRCMLDWEFIQFKAAAPLSTRDTAEVQFYLLYRAQWAPFTWNDLSLLNTYEDSMWIIDPIENIYTGVDPVPYRWYTYPKTRDNFGDSVWNMESVWGAGFATKGVCDEDVNWYYTCVAVDTTPTVRFSPEPCSPVGEVDQWLYEGDNIFSYPVDILVRRADSLAMVIDTIDAIPAIEAIHRWDAVGQQWEEIAFIFYGIWIGNDPVAPGDVFRGIKTDPTPVLWTAAIPGYVPFDTEITNHTLTTLVATGDNFVMLPYQTYNMLLATNSMLEGVDYVRAKDMLTDISCAQAIHQWYGASQNWVEIGYYFYGVPIGDTRVLPGLPYRVIVDGTCTWPPE